MHLNRIGLFLLMLTLPLPARANAEDEGLQARLEKRGYDGAMASRPNEGVLDLTHAAKVARDILAVTLERGDPTARQFALRAAAHLRDPALIDATRPLALSPDRYEQALALDALVNSDPTRARDELLRALDSPYRAIRLRGLQGLSQLHDPALIDRFDAVLMSDSDPDLRLVAVRALLGCGTSSVVSLLHRGLDDAADPVQTESVKALVQLGDRGVSAIVRRRILAEDAPSRRAFALRLAGNIPDRELLDDVTPFLADPNPEIRASAAAATIGIASLLSPPAR